MSDLETYRAQHYPKVDDMFLTRRQFLQRAGMGFGALSLATLLGDTLAPGANAAHPVASLLPRNPHFSAKAKRVVHIFAQGAPSQVDTWDPKPALAFQAHGFCNMNTAAGPLAGIDHQGRRIVEARSFTIPGLGQLA